MLEGGDWVLDMLKHVIRYDEIQRSIRERGETCAIIHHIRHDERTPLPFPPAQSAVVALTQPGLIEIVNVANRSTTRRPQREIQRPNLDSLAPQESQSGILTNRFQVRRTATEHHVSCLSLTTAEGIDDPRRQPRSLPKIRIDRNPDMIRTQN